MRLSIRDEIIREHDLRKWADDHLSHPEAWIQDIAVVLSEWYDDSEHISVRTSGSTGAPKLITHSKSSIIQSALLTGAYLGLEKGMLALNVLPVKFIAGRMMLYRSLVLDLDIICLEPKLDFGKHLIGLNRTIQFCAMTPLQVEMTMKSTGALDHIESLIIGGAPISQALQSSILSSKPRCFATYGMTETITHIAMKKLNHPDTELHFTALSGVSFTIDEGLLEINAKHLDDPIIKTNDIVELIDQKSFIWKGRADDVINRGGVKLWPQEIESKLAPHISSRFIIIKGPNPKSGEEPVLVIEGKNRSSKANVEHVIAKYLPTLWRPSEIMYVDQFLMTNTGKIIRSYDRYFHST